MEDKKYYSSYAQIERDLEILKLEKELNYQKLVLSIQKTKESLTLPSIVSGLLGSYKTIFSESYGKLISMIIPYIVEWFINRKRGN